MTKYLRETYDFGVRLLEKKAERIPASNVGI
jgi:hypothetical protein